MYNLCIIIIIIAIPLGWSLAFYDNDDYKHPYMFIGVMIGVILPITLLVYVIDEQPKAIDVYQGKTTLEITYKDGVAIDSIVVFKDKEK